MISAPLIDIVNDPFGSVETILSALRGANGKFFLCIGSTHTSDIPGISAAGITPEARRLTPCTDAEALIAGRALTAESIPVSPGGVASPVVITRACLNLLKIAVEVVDCGTFAPPKVAVTTIGGRVAGCLSTGVALTLAEAARLFECGKQAGIEAAKQFEYIVLGECVPGGTTTALGVLSALGFCVRDMLSSSLPRVEHDVRHRLVLEGLEKAGKTGDAYRQLPLEAVASLGDPMQPFVAGVALAASHKIPVILGGGSQMLAVYALAKAILSAQSDGGEPEPSLMVATTKWVAYDQGARTRELSQLLTAPYLASCPDFHRSRHVGLQAYEQGNVKEGAGAGASMLIAQVVGGFSESEILASVDDTYDELVLHSNAILF